MQSEFVSVWIYIACGIGAYLLGSISPAIIISDTFYARADIRNYGSGNAGTSNMMRKFGLGAGICTFLLDILKGALGAYFGRLFGGDLGALIACTGITIGHMFPVYYGFKGGKGIASAAGMLLVLMPIPAVVILAAAITIIITTRYASVGSLSGVLMCAAASFVFYPENLWLQLTTVIVMVLAFVAHRANIVRLFKGQENKMNFSKKKKEEKGA